MLNCDYQKPAVFCKQSFLLLRNPFGNWNAKTNLNERSRLVHRAVDESSRYYRNNTQYKIQPNSVIRNKLTQTKTAPRRCKKYTWTHAQLTRLLHVPSLARRTINATVMIGARKGF